MSYVSRAPDDRSGLTNVRVVRLGWGGPGGRDDRWGISPLGLFLIILGGLLLVETLLPEIRIVGSALVVAVGVAALARWAVERRTWALYAGSVLVALGLPGLLSDVGAISGPGWGTLALGVAFLWIAVVRAAERGGWGWQLTFGAILAFIGGSQIAVRQVPGLPAPGQIVWPILLLGLGVLLIMRAGGLRR